jgi:hypothetical protein
MSPSTPSAFGTLPSGTDFSRIVERHRAGR